MQNRQLRIPSLISGLMLAALLSGCMRTQAWTDVNIRGLDLRESVPSLAISATGVPFMLYRDVINDHKFSVAKFEKDAWIPVGMQGFSPAIVSNVFLKVNANGIPYVAYKEIVINDNHKLWVMKLEGEGWVPVGPPVILMKNEITRISLALNASGTPYVAYTEFDRNEHKLLVMKFEEGIWIPVGPPIYSLKGVGRPSLALSSTGIPYVAYMDFDNSAKLSVVKLEGATWVPVGPPGFSTITDDYPSLALDAAGVPYVVFQGDDSRLSVMKYTEGAWVFVGQPDTSLKPGYFPSMMLDAAGVPHVAYLQYASPGFKFWMKKFERGNWVFVEPPGFSSEKAGQPQGDCTY